MNVTFALFIHSVFHCRAPLRCYYL